jgi:hypothetical protein
MDFFSRSLAVVSFQLKVASFVNCFRWEVYIENGSSLCMGRELCRGIELQVFPSFLGMLTIIEKNLDILMHMPEWEWRLFLSNEWTYHCIQLIYGLIILKQTFYMT